MIDYRAIEALSAVVECQGFEAAAKKLHITQSAISQRIKALEQYYGQPILVRSLPYKPTKLGLTLLNHYKRVKMLEEDLNTQFTSESSSPTISIAISRDSLESWFRPVMQKLKNILPIRLEIIADDQEVTIEYLQKGMVSACASTYSKAIMGCKVNFLGFFDYILVASPEFKSKYFTNKKSDKQNLLMAPTIIFDSKDDLHAAYLQHFFNLSGKDLTQHIVPSVAGFRQFALQSYAYALIPKIDIIEELQNKKLINLFPKKVWQMPIYWHTWSIETEAYKKFNDLVISIASKILRQP